CLVCFRLRAPLSSTLFPYTTLFRSPLSAIERGLESGLVCQVRSLRGEVLVRTPNTPHATLAEHGVGFHEVSMGDERWRSFTLKRDRKSTRLNSSHVKISYAVFCLKK